MSDGISASLFSGEGGKGATAVEESLQKLVYPQLTRFLAAPNLAVRQARLWILCSAPQCQGFVNQALCRAEVNAGVYG